MKTLISYDSPLYFKRMARELNNRSAGFYHDGERWTQAVTETRRNLAEKTETCLRISRMVAFHIIGSSEHTDYASKTKTFNDLTNVVFGDGYGGTICASRQPSK